MNCKCTIQDWQESISYLEDDKFFNLIRMYLGEIKTPYNKQRLIEQLASYIKNEKNTNTLIDLLDEFDIKVLSAISFINNPTRQILADFFAGDYTMAELYAELSSLNQRLVVFTKKDSYSDKQYYYINPLLWDNIKDYIGIQNILQEPVLSSLSLEDVFSINPNFICALLSFINTNGIACKSDGIIKKNDQNKLESIFPGKFKAIQLLVNAFVNLNLIRDTEKKMEIDYKRLELFAALEPSFQYSFICAAACSRFSREGLKKEAQLFLDCIRSIPESGYTRNTLVKLAFLVSTKFSLEDSSKSRFSQILQAAHQENISFMSEQAGSIIERMLDSAIDLGLLHLKGKDSDNKEIYEPSLIFTEKTEQQKIINMDSAFTVTLMPGGSLKQLIPFTRFLQIKSYGVVTEFEISRQSVSSGFDTGLTPNDILLLLKECSAYDLPQNFIVTVTDWYNTYSSAVIYHGYILKVSEANVSFVEKNPKITPHIKEKLAEGIYLLDIPVSEDIQGFVDQSGLVFMGKVKQAEINAERINFPVLREGCPVQFEKKELKKINYNNAAVYINKLKDKLTSLDVQEVQFKILSDKINQRVILNEEQLSLSHIRTEVLEAAGTDYSGKIHLIEAAIKCEEEMEIVLPQFNKEQEYFTMIGKPLGITKQVSDAIVRVEFLPEHNVDNLVVSKITHLRRLRF